MDLEDVRLAVYTTFARHGRPPTIGELADQVDASADQLRQGLQQLATARHLVLDDAGNIVMAHPFSAIPLGFSVMGTSTLWWGGCAWDSFAMVHLLPWEPSLLVATTCPGCSTPHAWNVSRSAPPPGDQVAHFLTPAASMWDDVVPPAATSASSATRPALTHGSSGARTSAAMSWTCRPSGASRPTGTPAALSVVTPDETPSKPPTISAASASPAPSGVCEGQPARFRDLGPSHQRS
jgi:hypothetical protein